MKSNELLQQDVEDAIKWEPSLHAAEIGVTVKDGVVTLMGTVDSFAKKMEAERAAKAVEGVKAVVEKIDVKLKSTLWRTDEEIATDAIKSIDDNWSVPSEKVQIKVEKGWIYLSGILAWNYQREAAKKSVEDLPGVLGVVNNIQIQSEVDNAIEKKLIVEAINRHWALSQNSIRVDVSGAVVTLSGSVYSVYEKEEAEKIAWKTPGMRRVNNALEVQYQHALNT